MTALRKGEAIDSALIKYLVDGKDRFRDELVGFWQNVGIVAALIGAIAVTVPRSIPRIT